MATRSSRSAARGAVICLVLALVAAALLTGCGSGATATGTGSASAKAAELKNAEWGFSLLYPAAYVKVQPPLDSQSDPGLLYQVYLADPTGAKSGGSALDVLGITVRRMSKSAKPGDLRAHATEFKAMAAQLAGKPEGLRIVEPFRPATLGGRPALKGAYVYRVKGADVAAVAYLVPIGDRAYWVTGQASRETWTTSGRDIGSALGTMAFD
jgi:hypothetical protein